jgi:glutaredoxin
MSGTGRRGRGTTATLRRAAACVCAGAPLLSALLLSALPVAAQGQMYKWTDAGGTVHYSDTPPPGPQQGQARVLRPEGAPPSGAPALPYELARAARNHPVTLYTTARCDACDQGRNLLATRGIPFAEKTVNTAEDQQQLRSIGGRDELPLLVVGTKQVSGFQAAAWNDALDAAAYPRKTMLPPGYRTGMAAPAAPAAAAATAPAGLPVPPARSTDAPAPDAAAARAQRQQPRQQAAPDKPKPDFQF